MKKYIYLHICCFNNWKTIVQTFIDKIIQSNLYNVVSEIRCVVLGDGNINELSKKYSKIKVIFQSDDTSFYERKILTMLYNHSQKEKFYVLYLHTKGIKYNGKNKCINDWVEYMTYFNVCKYQKMLELLKYNDVVGVNLEDKPENPIHFSGNFWWSKSEYISKLNLIYLHNWWNNPIYKEYLNVSDYNSPEFWITGQKNGKFSSIWNSGINHYLKEYPTHNYVQSYF